MVWRSGDVRTHRGYRIAERCAVLDGKARDRVSVVAAPDLRAVGQYARVKASAAAGAALNQHIRECIRQAVEQSVKTQYIAV